MKSDQRQSKMARKDPVDAAFRGESSSRTVNEPPPVRGRLSVLPQVRFRSAHNIAVDPPLRSVPEYLEPEPVWLMPGKDVGKICRRPSTYGATGRAQAPSTKVSPPLAISRSL